MKTNLSLWTAAAATLVQAAPLLPSPSDTPTTSITTARHSTTTPTTLPSTLPNATPFSTWRIAPQLNMVNCSTSTTLSFCTHHPNQTISWSDLHWVPHWSLTEGNVPLNTPTDSPKLVLELIPGEAVPTALPLSPIQIQVNLTSTGTVHQFMTTPWKGAKKESGYSLSFVPTPDLVGDATLTLPSIAGGSPVKLTFNSPSIPFGMQSMASSQNDTPLPQNATSSISLPSSTSQFAVVTTTPPTRIPLSGNSSSTISTHITRTTTAAMSSTFLSVVTTPSSSVIASLSTSTTTPSVVAVPSHTSSIATPSSGSNSAPITTKTHEYQSNPHQTTLPDAAYMGQGDDTPDYPTVPKDIPYASVIIGIGFLVSLVFVTTSMNKRRHLPNDWAAHYDGDYDFTEEEDFSRLGYTNVGASDDEGDNDDHAFRKQPRNSGGKQGVYEMTTLRTAMPPSGSTSSSTLYTTPGSVPDVVFTAPSAELSRVSSSHAINSSDTTSVDRHVKEEEDEDFDDFMRG